MTKQEVYNIIKQKLVIDDKELDKLYNDLESALKTQGKKYDEASVLNRLYVYLTPSLGSSATKHKGVFLGVEDNFGFNQIVEKVKFDAIKRLNEDKTKAIAEGVIDSESNLLWHFADGVNVAKFKIGKPITSLDYSAVGYVFVEESESETKKYVLKKINLRGKRRDFVLKNTKTLFNKEIEFAGIEKENNVINDSKYFNLKVVNETPQQIMNLLGTYAKDNCLNLKDVTTFWNKNIEKAITLSKAKQLDMPVFLRGSISRIIVNEIGDNNIIDFKDLGFEKSFSVFLPKNIELPQTGSLGVIFGGKLRFNENDVERPYSLNAFMCYEPEENKNFMPPESVKKFMIVEEEISDTLKQQEMLGMQKKEEW